MGPSAAGPKERGRPYEVSLQLGLRTGRDNPGGVVPGSEEALSYRGSHREGQDGTFFAACMSFRTARLSPRMKTTIDA